MAQSALFHNALESTFKGFLWKRSSWPVGMYLEPSPISENAEDIPILLLVFSNGEKVPYTPTVRDLYAKDWKPVEMADLKITREEIIKANEELSAILAAEGMTVDQITMEDLGF